MNPKLLPLAVAGALALPASAAQSIVYVDEDATGPVHDGTTWCRAFQTLYEGLAAAGSGDTIKVAGGLYTPDPSTVIDPRLASFVLPAGVRVEGAYAGCGAPNPELRDYANHISYIRGDPLRDDETTGDTSNNSYHVLRAHLISHTTLDGLYVDGGKAANGLVADGLNGAGMLCTRSSIEVVNCIFQGNEAQSGPDATDGRGGSVYLRRSKAVFVDTLFRESIAGESGGGVHSEASATTFLDCFFAAGISVLRGGGMYADDLSSASFFDTTFLVCAGGEGGGLHLEGAQALASRCTFQGGWSEYGGGAYAYKADAQFVNCSFQFYNHAVEEGGALYAVGGKVTLVNALIAGAQAGQAGGAIRMLEGKLEVVGGTIAENTAGSGAAGIDLSNNASASVHDTILWANSVSGSTTEAEQIRLSSGASLTIGHSDVQGWTGAFGGIGNFGLDPQFAAPGSDWHLLPGSPCIGAGDNAALLPDAADLDGDGNSTEPTPLDLDDLPRVQSGVVDVGAYENG